MFELREGIAHCVQVVRGEVAPAASGRDGLWSTGLCLFAEDSIRRRQLMEFGDMGG